ncbi:MAG TPA: Ig-like domain-containing protein [Vicinamibacterales bacterium]
MLMCATMAHSPRGVAVMRAQGLEPGEVSTFAGNAQHTSIFETPAVDLNVIRWSTSIDLNQSFRNAHYGAPLVTSSNVVLVPVKTATDGFQVSAFDGASGAQLYAPLTTDYVLPLHNWYPTYNPALASHVDPGTGQRITRLYYAGAGGTVFYVERPDSANPGAPVRRAFYGLDAFQANASGFISTVFVNTPLTADRQGNVFFGFRVQGTAPAPLSTVQSGFARLTPGGAATFVLAGPAAGDAAISRDSHTSAPALSNDDTLLYVVVKSAPTTTYGYLLALDATTLQTRHRVFLRDPRGGGQNNASISDDSTASPTVAPDGDVYIGVQGNPGNGSRGFLLRFSSDLSTEKTPGGFGWDSTAAVVPAGMVPSYSGGSSYLIFAKYNNYAISDGDGVNRIALLDPDSTQIDPHPSSSGLTLMREVLTVIGPTPDRDRVSPAFPNAVREWCINTAAVNPATRSIFAPNEDGFIYRWDLATNSLSQSVALTPGFLEPYVPTVVGPDGTVFTLNGGTLFAVGRAGGAALTLESSKADARMAAIGESLTFTARAAGATTGTVVFRDVHYPDGVAGSTSSELARVTLSNGTAAFTTSTLPAGSHFISATHDATGTTTTRVQKIHRSATTTVVTAPAGTQLSGPVTFTALVVGHDGGVPTGMVTFLDGSRVLAQVPLSRERTASFTLPGLGAPTRTITAVYASDPLFAASSGNVTVPDTVPPGMPTGLAAAAGPNPHDVTLTWQPNPSSDGSLVYEIWRHPPLSGGATRIGTAVAPSFVDTRTGSRRIARYFIVAVDGAGNRSPRSAIVWGQSK